MNVNSSGLNLKIARIKRGMNQDEVCRLANIGRSTLSKLETNQLDPKKSIMIKLSEVLQVPVQDLFFN